MEFETMRPSPFRKSIRQLRTALGQINEMKSYEFIVPSTLVSNSKSIEIRDELKKTVLDSKSINEFTQ